MRGAFGPAEIKLKINSRNNAATDNERVKVVELLPRGMHYVNSMVM